jgi:hypothetical protein
LFPEILKHIDILVYNGQFDLICNHLGTVLSNFGTRSAMLTGCLYSGRVFAFIGMGRPRGIYGCKPKRVGGRRKNSWYPHARFWLLSFCA